MLTDQGWVDGAGITTSQHTLGQVITTLDDGIERGPGGVPVGPVAFVENACHARQSVDRRPFFVVTVIKTILAPLDHGVAFAVGDQQMGPVFSDDRDSHVILPGRQSGAAPAIRSSLAAMMKSFSCRPLIFFV